MWFRFTDEHFMRLSEREGEVREQRRERGERKRAGIGEGNGDGQYRFLLTLPPALDQRSKICWWFW